MLKDISLHCEPGHIYGFVGHNGSGKTVLFKCICGFLECDKGEIRELFLEMKSKGKVILLASHNREEISILCDEVYEMENGSIAPAVSSFDKNSIF